MCIGILVLREITSLNFISLSYGFQTKLCRFALIQLTVSLVYAQNRANFKKCTNVLTLRWLLVQVCLYAVEANTCMKIEI